MALPWEEEIPPRILKLINLGLELEWMNCTTLVSRFQKPQAQPFFAGWKLTDGKWKFDQARVLTKFAGLAPLGARDIAIYLEDPTVIEKEDPNGNS